jgi:hypothetical protein
VPHSRGGTWCVLRDLPSEAQSSPLMLKCSSLEEEIDPDFAEPGDELEGVKKSRLPCHKSVRFRGGACLSPRCGSSRPTARCRRVNAQNPQARFNRTCVPNVPRTGIGPRAQGGAGIGEPERCFTLRISLENVNAYFVFLIKGLPTPPRRPAADLTHLGQSTFHFALCIFHFSLLRGSAASNELWPPTDRPTSSPPHAEMISFGTLPRPGLRRRGGAGNSLLPLPAADETADLPLLSQPTFHFALCIVHFSLL